MRTPEINSSLEATISRDRLEKYLQDQGGDLDDALSLYERNMQLSAAFYPVLQCLEVSLRNKIHVAMQQKYGAGWLMNGAAPLKITATESIQEVWDELKKPDSDKTSGDIIAELKFSFWIGLLGQDYDNTTWRSALHKAFPNTKDRRKKIQNRLNVIRRFRNRIAHHEPIFHKDLQVTHDEIIEAIGWMCPDTKVWADRMSPVSTVL